MGIADVYQQINKQLEKNQQTYHGDRERWHILREVLNWIGQPDRHLKLIHVVGTDGKGSTGAMTAAVLRGAGYRTGHFSSPAILDDREMIQLNGEAIRETDFITSYRRILKALEKHGGQVNTLTKFEWWTLIAIDYFYHHEVQFAIVEAGLAGLCDATNAIAAPLIVAFTKIDLDYEANDTDRISEITQDKAGAIKPGAVVINYPGQASDVTKVLQSRAQEVGAHWYDGDKPSITIIRSTPTGLVLNVDHYKQLQLPLTGSYQVKNLAIVLEIVRVLRKHGTRIPVADLAQALANMKVRGRMEYDAKNNILYDGAHNPSEIENLVTSLHAWHLEAKPVYVLGLMKDKNWRDILEQLLPDTDQVIAVKPATPQGMSADELAAKIVMQSNVNVEIADDPEAAINLARRVRKDTKRLIVVTGSFYTLRAIHAGGFTLNE